MKNFNSKNNKKRKKKNDKQRKVKRPNPGDIFKRFTKIDNFQLKEKKK